MVGNKRSIESDAEPLPRKEEEDVEQNMEEILGQHQGVQTGALVYRILVVGLQLIKSDDLQRKQYFKEDFSKKETYVENGEENEESIDDESNNVGKSCKGEGHSAPSCLNKLCSEIFSI